jgi:glycosyltransferase involved in cell wall biosynthesis
LKLSVIVPVFNEAATIESIIKRILAVSIEKEVIVVDDGSTDGTRERLAELARSNGHRHDLCCLFHEKNQGKGAAVQTGLSAVTGDVVMIQDADLEYHPEDYPSAFRLIEQGWADAVYGSRFLGPHRAFLFWHFLGNKLLTLMTNILFDGILTDMETGFKMVRTEVLKSLKIRSYSFDFEVEVTAKLFKNGYRVYEIPIMYTGRTYEEGKKITWRDGLRALRAIARFRFLD